MAAPTIVLREALATVLRGELGDTVTVYSSPPETTTAPAVTIGPGRPYINVNSYGTDQARLRLTIQVPRSAGAPGLDDLDQLVWDVRLAVLTIPAFAWTEVQAVGVMQDTGAVQHLTAIVDLVAELKE